MAWQNMGSITESDTTDFSIPEFFLAMNSTNYKSRDPVIVERRNLVNISKLIVKELIDTSMKYGRMLDSNDTTLQHFFIVLEHALRHGLRPKKGILGPKKELWDILQLVEKISPEAQDLTSTIRELPSVKTQTGRARAWLRLALMQKKLADYLKLLIDKKEEVLAEYFEPDALMMSEEAIVVVGLLFGLNIIDCNLWLKEEDLDCVHGVIDFSLYLRSSHEYSMASPSVVTYNENMSTVLDQKNYVEELNRHLNATVANLQTHVETLTTTNTLIKEDLDIAKVTIEKLTRENTILRAQKNQKVNTDASIQDDCHYMGKNESTTDGKKPELEELRMQLHNEKKVRQECEKELHAQLSFKAEKELAMKLLERDVHEKQNIIISLRKQLEDIKVVNLEMYKKLQESEALLKHKIELITKHENKSITMATALDTLDQKYERCERDRLNIAETLQKEKERLIINEEKLLSLDDKFKKESEKNNSLQKVLEKEMVKNEKMQKEIDQLKAVNMKYLSLQEEYFKLNEKCSEREKALEELGVVLSVSKLELSDLKEGTSNANITPPETTHWASDKDAVRCISCSKEFTLTRRKHHCRRCGNIFCHPCSDNSIPLTVDSTKPVRVCDNCHHDLLARFSVVAS